MANLKRKKAKKQRAGCLLCKPWKAMGNSMKYASKQEYEKAYQETQIRQA